MPIPEKWWISEEVEKEHWYKEVIWETMVGIRQNGIDGFMYQKWKFKVSKIGKYGICPKCLTSDNVYLNAKPSGVYKVCVKCAATGGHSSFGPLPTEEGKGRDRIQYAELLESRFLQTEREIAEVGNKLGWIFEARPARWHP
jgi:hypothetical protein